MPLNNSSGQALDDPNRLAALYDTELMDSPPEVIFDQFTRLVRLALKCDIALISLVDSSRQFFKSVDALAAFQCPLRETPLNSSFCQYVVTRGKVLRIADARHDSLVCNNSFIQMGAIAYLGAPITTLDGFILGAICAVCSTAREWTEDDMAMMEILSKLVSSEIQYRSLTIALRTSLQDLQKTEKERDQVLHMLVHDLRTPIGAMISSLDLLKEASEPDQYRDLIQTAQENGGELLEMINDILQVNRLETSAHPLTLESINVGSLLRHVFQLAKPLADHARHELSVTYPPHEITLIADRSLLTRVLLNLVSNAIKFCPSGSKITITAQFTTEFPRCEFRVIDNGPGVPQAERRQIFEKYERGSVPLAQSSSSFGLGLNFCKAAVRAHGGSLSVQDAPGGGSEFVMIIPNSPQGSK